MKNMNNYKSGPKFYREIDMFGAHTKGSLTGKGAPARNGEDRKLNTKITIKGANKEAGSSPEYMAKYMTKNVGSNIFD